MEIRKTKAYQKWDIGEELKTREDVLYYLEAALEEDGADCPRNRGNTGRALYLSFYRGQPILSNYHEGITSLGVPAPGRAAGNCIKVI
jgi:hypothetical protein